MGGLCLGGGSLTETSLNRDPLIREPPSGQTSPVGTETHLDREPQKEHWTRDRDPPEGTWDQTARQEVTSYRDRPCGQNNRDV